MKSSTNFLAVSLIAAIVALVTVAASSHQRKRFEVKVVYPANGPQGTAELRHQAIELQKAEVSEAGNQGWELVAVTASPLGGDSTFYFKREIAE